MNGNCIINPPESTEILATYPDGVERRSKYVNNWWYVWHEKRKKRDAPSGWYRNGMGCVKSWRLLI